MPSYSRVLLSGTPSSGQVIPVAAVATPGTLVHTAVDGAGAFDEVYLWASNVTAAAALLTVEWGGAADPANHLVKALTIPPHSAPIPIALGQNINGALEVRAFANITDAINLSGFVNRIS